MVLVMVAVMVEKLVAPSAVVMVGQMVDKRVD